MLSVKGPGLAADVEGQAVRGDPSGSPGRPDDAAAGAQFVAQTHPPGVEAEVNFGDVAVRLAGELVTCYLFSFRLSY
ncbi:hypothetical protein GCM10010289_00670 [Streptomyces violascens]|uniref:Uncharacterized protein n=1 Tax=Streptomyces violascens TaxID=67381 RepID=A0ABQ3QRV3_9ACTN|nr:hypothetical protein GCM10010289_00670 [Streptomyces violascens]GHI39975.1 hypothetical protein Sviol_43830 [Streptomyces violascens]